MDTGDPYAVLGVPRDATPDQVKQAYEQKLNAAAKTGALDLMQRIDAAYEVLRNPHRRRMFDETGTTAPIPRIPWHAAPTTPGRNWTPREVVPRRQSRRSGAGALALVAAIAIVPVAWKAGVVPRGTRNAAAALRGDVGAVAVSTGAAPSPHAVAHPHRLLPMSQAPAGAGGFALIDTHGARWDPCRPIHYVLSGAEPWPGANRLLTEAVGEVSRLTGLAFTYDGATPEQPDVHRLSFQRQQYGDRWAPVLVAWTNSAAVPDLAGRVAGVAGPHAALVHAQSRLVSGTVFYDATDLSMLEANPRTQWEVPVILRHELGHLVGLNHVQDATSLMFPSARSSGQHFNPGDLRGLAYAGSGTCFTVG